MKRNEGCLKIVVYHCKQVEKSICWSACESFEKVVTKPTYMGEIKSNNLQYNTLGGWVDRNSHPVTQPIILKIVRFIICPPSLMIKKS